MSSAEMEVGTSSNPTQSLEDLEAFFGVVMVDGLRTQSDLIQDVPIGTPLLYLTQAEAFCDWYNRIITLASSLKPVIVKSYSKTLHAGCLCAASKELQRAENMSCEMDELNKYMHDEAEILKLREVKTVRELDAKEAERRSLVTQVNLGSAMLSVQLLSNLAARQADLDESVESPRLTSVQAHVASVITSHRLTL